jgi:type II restriction enzyme
VKLELSAEIAARYKSFSQKARVLTEKWASDNLYCPACPSDTLEHTTSGKKVVDFVCPECDEQYQLKSQSHPFGFRVVDSAYEPKIEAIRTGTIPNFLFLRYDLKELAIRIQDLFLIPRYFMWSSLIERRKPLSERARRSGWVGSNILLGNLPDDAKIPIVKGGQEMPKNVVRNSWVRYLFLREKTQYSRGWLADVLARVRKLEKETFSLVDVYAFESELARLHPKNKHIKPKIRQQLQVLRDHGIVEFLGKGVYRIRKP